MLPYLLSIIQPKNIYVNVIIQTSQLFPLYNTAETIKKEHLCFFSLECQKQRNSHAILTNSHV